MISQFFVLSPRGDSIISKDYRGDIVRGTADIFFRKVKFWKGDPPPIFNLDGINFLYIKRHNLFFVCTTRSNVSPAFVMELLERTTKVFKDYCGILTEESIRKNFTLVYELLDEIMDFGYAQGSSTELLKAFIFNEPVEVVDTSSMLGSLKLPDLNPKTTPSTSVHKPISMSREQRGQKNEIFVDIVERISATFNSTGTFLNSEIDGSIQMKSYLTGSPELRLALNENLVIGRDGAGPGYGVVLDDCNFHEVAQLDEFEQTRTIIFNPPDGEFVLMNYRITGEYRAPFRMFPFVEHVNPFKVEMVLKVRADMPEESHGANVVVRFNVPKATSSVSCDLGAGATGETWEYLPNERAVVWTVKKFPGAQEKTLVVRMAMQQATTPSVRKEVGPITATFEIPMYNVSTLQVKYLRIYERDKSYNPYRWVRYVTQSGSYVCRVH